jgi:indoleamine 2,3-dioxygenase
MRWTLAERGFLPSPDPCTRLSNDRLASIEDLGRSLPDLVATGRFRAVAVQALGPPDPGTLPADDGAEAERLFLLFSYFASAYVHAPGQPKVGRLPAELAVPLVHIAGVCDRPPILSYASYCLHNWRRLDRAGPIALGNLELLQNFSLPGDGKEDEDWFILVHVDIEARAGPVLSALQSLPGVLTSEGADGLAVVLERVHDGLGAVNRTLKRMPEGCSSEVYFRKVRPYIFGFNDLIYEGCFGNSPRTYRGETGAQSSIMPAVLRALGVRHRSTLLTQHLDDMLQYMPAPHRKLVEGQVSVRDHVVRLAHAGGPSGGRLKDLYNACLAEVVSFRTLHFEYAINYIQKKVDNPLATGGTPYVPWLHHLIEETREHFL